MSLGKSNFNLERFKTEVLGQGLARTNRFEVLITPPPSLPIFNKDKERVSMFCEVSNFPPLSLNVRQLRILGPNFQRPITSDYGGDGISMIFHVDREMKVKSFFDNWLELIVSNQDWSVLYPEDYQTTLNIRQIDEQNNVTYEIELLEAFPRSMNIMELNNSAQSQTHRLNIIFAYRYWRKRVVEVAEVPIVTVSALPIIVPPSPIPYNRRGVEWNAGNEQGSYTESGSSDFAVGA